LSFFSDDQAAELRQLFFESSAENLQSLNEEGLELEQHSGDPEVVRRVRRTVHTLKGDSAAAGFMELSEVAHELEDALTAEVAKRQGPRLAEIVFAAADLFQEMLNAYHANQSPPSGELLKRMVREMAAASTSSAATVATPVKTKAPSRFPWTEYDRMVIEQAALQGRKVLQISMSIDPACMVKAVAVQMAKNALADLGMQLAFSPEDGSDVESIDCIEAAITSSFDRETIIRKCMVPSIIADVAIVPFSVHAVPHSAVQIMAEEDLLHLNETDPVVLDQEEIATTASSALSTTRENMLRVDAEKIDSVMNLVGELIIGKSMLLQTLNEFSKRFPKDTLRSKFADALSFQVRVMNDLQKAVMKVRMVPVEQLFRRFPRIVRDISKTCGKDVELVLEGQDTDLDKSILDMLAEPLAHLVRNAIDHGIERPEIRLTGGKPARGTVKLNSYHQGNQIVIEISDDGNGIDKAKLADKALQLGLVTPDALSLMTDGEVLQLIFHPGLSTADQVTNISGRGVGMDVVKTVLDRLKGTVSIQTEVGMGTRFLLRVPLTLAIIKALLFHSAGRLYAVPLATVVEITRAVDTDIHVVEQQEVLRLRENVMTLVRLNRLRDAAPTTNKKIFIVVVAIGDRHYGLVVDRLVGEEELVIKAMDDNLVATELVSGASILGDGTVVLILNTPAVVERYSKFEVNAVNPAKTKFSGIARVPDIEASA